MFHSPSSEGRWIAILTSLSGPCRAQVVWQAPTKVCRQSGGRQISSIKDIKLLCQDVLLVMAIQSLQGSRNCQQAAYLSQKGPIL